MAVALFAAHLISARRREPGACYHFLSDDVPWDDCVATLV